MTAVADRHRNLRCIRNASKPSAVVVAPQAMRLTTFTDYSLRVLIYLAAKPRQRATIAEIAAAFDISENHLMKVVHFLGKAGLLVNMRGKGGGLELAAPASTISLGYVVKQTEGTDRPAECFDPKANLCRITSACRLRGVLEDAVRAFYAVLDQYTLEDITHNRQVLAKILSMPHPHSRHVV
jgi:Rrf2 family nitric oxide-sensitive transcriptional repressor